MVFEVVGDLGPQQHPQEFRFILSRIRLQVADDLRGVPRRPAIALNLDTRDIRVGMCKIFLVNQHSVKKMGGAEKTPPGVLLVALCEGGLSGLHQCFGIQGVYLVLLPLGHKPAFAGADDGYALGKVHYFVFHTCLIFMV